MEESGSTQGKGRGFCTMGGSCSWISMPRLNWVKSTGAQFRWMLRRLFAPSEMEPKVILTGFSQMFSAQKASRRVLRQSRGTSKVFIVAKLPLKMLLEFINPLID